MKPEELPPLYQADLDQEAYEALLRDLANLDELEVSVKSAPRAFAPERAAVTLADARHALEAGEVRAIQVRYLHEAKVWVDTILRTPAGLRLVRIQPLDPNDRE
jgi:hypothetical protein